MAAPVADKIILPSDTGNTGKKVRTQTRVIGADTVHEHYFIAISRRAINGLYFAPTSLQSVQATGHNGTTTGFAWLECPVGAAVRGRLRHIELAQTNAVATAIDHPTAPRIVLARFTFTGTASGTILTPAKRNPSDTANVANLRTASTGMTVTLGAAAWAALVPGVDLTTSGIYNSFFTQEFDPTIEDDFLDFGPGEGLVLYQPDTGTTSDQRRFTANFRWDEYDNA